MKKVLVTGMSGLIGGLLREHLEKLGNYELSALNRSEVEGIKTHRADISDLESIKSAFVGVDVVVHLAAYLGDDDFYNQLPVNVVGTYNVFEAARLAGVERIVYASSGSTIRGKEHYYPYKQIASGEYDQIVDEIPVVTHEEIHPGGVYGAMKVWGEALGRHFSDEFDISILCVRIGSVTEGNKPAEPRQKSIFLSHRDVCQILQLCLDAPKDLRYDIFLATSDNRWNYRDLTHAKDILGFVPVDSAEKM